MSLYRVIRHPLVDRDVERIALFLLDYTTLESVAAKLDSVEADISALAANPFRGTKRDEIHPGLRALPSAKNGVIAFEVNAQTRTVRVLSVTWGGADWMGWVRGRMV